MTRDEAITEIKNLAGFRMGTMDDTILQTYLQRAQQHFESGLNTGMSELPWFLHTERSDRSTAADEERLPVPTDFLREVEEDALYLVPADATEKEIPLCKDDTDFLREKYPRGTTGQPKEYSLDNKYFRLFPTPDDSYTMRMVYFKQDDALTSNIENQWLKYAPWVLISQAGWLFCSSLRDASGIQIFTTLRADAVKALSKENEARKHTQRRYQMGGRI